MNSSAVLEFAGLFTGRRKFLKTGAACAGGILFLPFRALSASSDAPMELRRTTFVMGSIATITLFTEDVASGHLAIDSAFREMREIEKLLSVFDPMSQVSLLNRNGFTSDIPVDRRVIDVLDAAGHMHRRTGGAFDITVEPLMQLYGFRLQDAERNRFPTDRELAVALDGVGIQNILSDHIGGTVRFAHPQTKLDPGGIGVGYAIDRAVHSLRKQGITSALINHSGDLFAIGSPPDESGWEVGIVHPLETREVIATVCLRDAALSTSGNYQSVVAYAAGTIGHILDPRSGINPDAYASVSVVAPTAVEADGLSTGIFVQGMDVSENPAASSDGIRVHTVRVQDNRLASGWLESPAPGAKQW